MSFAGEYDYVSEQDIETELYLLEFADVIIKVTSVWIATNNQEVKNQN